MTTVDVTNTLRYPCTQKLIINVGSINMKQLKIYFQVENKRIGQMKVLVNEKVISQPSVTQNIFQIETNRIAILFAFNENSNIEGINRFDDSDNIDTNMNFNIIYDLIKFQSTKHSTGNTCITY